MQNKVESALSYRVHAHLAMAGGVSCGISQMQSSTAQMIWLPSPLAVQRAWNCHVGDLRKSDSPKAKTKWNCFVQGERTKQETSPLVKDKRHPSEIPLQLQHNS
jgi:hypothetical protein